MGEATNDLRGGRPAALWAHVAFVGAATALLVRDPAGRGMWALLVGMALILWQLLIGSRFAWWVQIAGIVAALSGLQDAQRRTAVGDVDLSVFLDPDRVRAVGALLLAAGVCLLLPSVRRYASLGPPVRRIAFFLAALFVASCPAGVLSADEHLPSEGSLEDVRGGDFVGGDERDGIAFYVTEERDATCLGVGRLDGSGLRCHAGEKVIRVEVNTRGEGAEAIGYGKDGQPVVRLTG